MKNKLDSVMARLECLCSEGGDDGGLEDETECERRVKLFEYVIGIDPNPLSC